MLWNVAFLLRPLTLNIDSRHKKPIPLLFYVLTVVITSSYFYVYLISMSWFVFVRSLETKELIPAMVVLSLGISSEIGTLKFFYTFIYIDKVRKIVDEYLECDALVVPFSRFSKNLLTTLRFVKKRAIIYWLVIIGNGFAYWSKPLFMKGRHHLEDNLVIYGLEPMLESPKYEIAYFLMTAGVCFICYPPANVTILLIVVVGYTEAQMLALSEEILNIWDDANEYYNNLPSTNQNTNELKSKIINKYIKDRLKDITKSHARNINLLRQVEFVFRGAIAIGYVFLILGLIAELLGGLENTFLQIPFAFIQVAIDCFTGQRVMDANIVFERAVYDCKWENFDKTNMKTVLLLLQNSQKTLTLSAGGVTMLNFRCLMSVIKSIYSAYTTLRTTMN
ncbi:hypothetical protein O3G_MSEX013774 [Manduca sexta]|uniref:Odorant receptor n=1 Tax=Manduca sexta TaxID=7130 RepID=A0A921ZUN4_MANSE|nr:hypothetical protein O3G_MSEX013774 [Manduca sexta]KAG6463263.1 hypothetical protein O3G_MSEX013774 [Manduca sexta]